MEIPRVINSLAYSPSCPCFSKTESISQLVFCCNHVNTNSEMLLHLTCVSRANRHLRQSDCLHTFPRLIDICANQIASFLEKLNSIQLTNEIDMSEDGHSSTFPRVTDICGNQIAPLFSRSRVFEKLKNLKVKK